MPQGQWHSNRQSQLPELPEGLPCICHRHPSIHCSSHHRSHWCRYWDRIWFWFKRIWCCPNIGNCYRHRRLVSYILFSSLKYTKSHANFYSFQQPDHPKQNQHQPANLRARQTTSVLGCPWLELLVSSAQSLPCRQRSKW